MTSVFIGGSRRLARMTPDVARRLDKIMEKGFSVLVGDANGFDRVAQAYLAGCGYQDVVVYCTAGVCRNNVGGWPLHAVEYHGNDRGLEFYTAKDDAMLRDADYGLFAWDGKSKGTLRNVRKMAERERPSSVYVSPIRKFVTVRSTGDAMHLSRAGGIDAASSEDLFPDSWREAETHLNGHSVEKVVDLPSATTTQSHIQEVLFDLSPHSEDDHNSQQVTAAIGGKKGRNRTNRNGNTAKRGRKAE